MENELFDSAVLLDRRNQRREGDDTVSGDFQVAAEYSVKIKLLYIQIQT
jgi:hypothetical protein